MKHIREYIVLAAAMVFLLSSCDEEANPRTYFDDYTQSMDYVGGTTTAKVYSNGSWAITTNYDDVVVTPLSGYGDQEITVTVPENDDIVTKAVRVIATTTIGESTYINKVVIAVAAKPFVFCEENEKEVSKEGGKVRFYVNSNHKWSVIGTSCSDGTQFGGTIKPEKWNINGVTVEVNVPANTSGANKITTIKIQLDEYSFANTELIINQPE